VWNLPLGLKKRISVILMFSVGALWVFSCY
jgi:hypothetical protein